MQASEIIVPDATAGQRLLRQQRWLVGVLAALALLAALLPLSHMVIAPRYFLPLHTLLEFASIVAAFFVFSTVWHTPARQTPAPLLVIAMVFFVTGWLDSFHALSSPGMSEFVTPASPEKAIAFWLVARLVVAAGLLGISFYPERLPMSRRARYTTFAALWLATLLVLWGVLFHEALLPATFVEGRGLTAFKFGFEWFTVALLVLAAWRYHGLAQRANNEFFPLLFGAAAVAALGEQFFTPYGSISDAQNLLGHGYKIVSYFLIYRAVLVVSVRRPYQLLATQAQELQGMNERLRIQSLALASTATPITVTDLDGRVRWANRAFQETFCGPSSELKPNFSLFSAPLAPRADQVKHMKARLEAGQVWRGLVYLQNFQGQPIIMDRTITPLSNEAGVSEGYVSVSDDVTEKTSSEMRHKRVLETSINGFWVVDTTGHLVEVNSAYSRMSGYTQDELLGMSVHQLDAVQGPEQVREMVEKIMRLGQHQFESRHRHKQGHEISVDVSVTYDIESDKMFVFLYDRTERVQAATEKSDLQRQLQQAQKVQALGQLTGGIAHDFNNILAAISGYSNLALDRLVPDKTSKLASYLGEVISASNRAQGLIARMLSFTRTQPNTQMGVISPAEVIAEVLAMLRASIPASIELSSRIDEQLHIRMDAGELNQMLVNLIINARDAIDEQGVIEIHMHRVLITNRICATCQQRLTGSYLAIDVLDNGNGIAPEDLPHLFEPFFTTKDVGKGTGLGLSVVQGILMRSGGHVLVSARPFQGTRFRLLFEIVQPEDALADRRQEQSHMPRGNGQLIWVLDDELAVARYLGELLQDWGYRVRLFNDPVALASLFKTEGHEPDLLITDQTMPGLSGTALVLRLHSLRPGLPILLCTGFSDRLEPAVVKRYGVSRLLHKPVAVPELLTALAQALAPPIPERRQS
ncbi:MASE3 domain-containing protein [Rhodoferax sp.]|uniref:hybrid sensor histidine kinase/response regulator n=1 Tax=Rhodoferax sp. TaxID=50421 RepID=UPI00272EEBB9|nr:MASE3 domain-containing protein [Rhodoferax sp.]MDP2442709.1 MASE3 domain-containing protein [Rhodoferax sp.]MDZ4206355.1 MASE3 domain-containing protein [Rhodoferax sp.]